MTWHIVDFITVKGANTWVAPFSLHINQISNNSQLLLISFNRKGSVQWKYDLGLWLRFCIILCHKGPKNVSVCIEMYGVARSSCTIGYQITHLEFLHIPGSNAHV